MAKPKAIQWLEEQTGQTIDYTTEANTGQDRHLSVRLTGEGSARSPTLCAVLRRPQCVPKRAATSVLRWTAFRLEATSAHASAIRFQIVTCQSVRPGATCVGLSRSP
jgi:hypothetical protein